MLQVVGLEGWGSLGTLMIPSLVPIHGSMNFLFFFLCMILLWPHYSLLHSKSSSFGMEMVIKCHSSGISLVF